MKKRALATLMAVCMVVVGMTGCGGSASGTSSIPQKGSIVESSVEESGSEEEDITDEYGRIYDEELGIYVYPSTESEGEENASTLENDRVGAEPMGESESGDNLEEQIIGDTTEISGLIIMSTSRNAQSGTCEVSSFNPENGETETISNFRFKNDDNSYFWGYAPYSGYYQFDSTYTKMATRKMINATGEEHAGWLMADGGFFDVIEEIGWARQGDFDDPVKASSIGFTDDDLFIFYLRNPDSPSNGKYYSVPVHDVSVENIQECHASAYSGYVVDDYNAYYDTVVQHGTPTSWIDGEHCILTPQRGLLGNPVTSVIFNIGDATSTDYIPGDSRNNWNGYVSPDGTQIAFTSVPRSGNESPDIFIIPINGGDPIRVPEHDFVLARANDDFALLSHSDCNIVIGWR